MKKYVLPAALIMVFASMLLLSGCKGPETEARSAFEDIMAQVVEGNASALGGINSGSDALNAAFAENLKGVTYTVNSAESGGFNSVKINVTVSLADYSKVLETYLEKLVEMTSSPGYQESISSMTREEYNAQTAQVLTDIISGGGFGVKETTCTVTMNKQNGVWTIEAAPNELTNVLYDNIISAYKNIV